MAHHNINTDLHILKSYFIVVLQLVAISAVNCRVISKRETSLEG